LAELAIFFLATEEEVFGAAEVLPMVRLLGFGGCELGVGWECGAVGGCAWEVGAGGRDPDV
jgi:hypothetical protein